MLLCFVDSMEWYGGKLCVSSVDCDYERVCCMIELIYGWGR